MTLGRSAWWKDSRGTSWPPMTGCKRSDLLAVAKAYVSRLARQRGVRHDIAENGDLGTRGPCQSPAATEGAINNIFSAS